MEGVVKMGTFHFLMQLASGKVTPLACNLGKVGEVSQFGKSNTTNARQIPNRNALEEH